MLKSNHANSSKTLDVCTEAFRDLHFCNNLHIVILFIDLTAIKP